MKKRGAIPLLILFEGLFAVIILFAMITLAKDWATGEATKQIFLTKDSALMIDALHAVPGDVVFNYRTQNFTDDLRMSTFLDNSVQLIPPLAPPSVFPFRPGTPNMVSDEFTIEKNKINTIKFVKTGSKIQFGKDLQVIVGLSCPSVNTKDENWRENKIVVDPQFGGKFKGDVINGIEESEINRQIAMSLSGLLKADSATVAETRSLRQDEERSFEERNAETINAEIIISIGIGPGQQTNPLNVYISSSIESRKLACLIANELSKFNFDSSNILTSDDPLLKDDIPSVSVELGSLSVDTQDKATRYGDAIYKAIKEYYEQKSTS